MKRWMAWAAAVAVAICGIAACQLLLENQVEQVEFLPVDIYGSRQSLAGVTAEISIQHGQMYWDSVIDLSQPQNTRTDFVCEERAQKWEIQQSLTLTELTQAHYDGDDYQGILLEDYGYGTILRDLASEMKPNSSIQETIQVSDYLDAHILGLSLFYSSKQYRCEIERESGAFYLHGIQRDYDDAIKAFHETFPVTAGAADTLTVEMTLDSQSQITSLTLTPEQFPQVQGFSYMNDDGCYVIFQAVDAQSGQKRQMGYPDGFGLYFIPWRSADHVYSNGQTKVFPDVSRAEKRYALEEGVQVLQLLGDGEADRCAILTLEDDMVWISTLELSTGKQLGKAMLLEYTGELQCQQCDGLYLVADQQNLVAVDQQGVVAMKVDLTDYPEVYPRVCYGQAEAAAWENGTFRVLGRAVPGQGRFLYALTLQNGKVQSLTEYQCSLLDSSDSLSLQSICLAG